MRLLGHFSSLLDLGCGQGVLARHLPKGVDYVGIDASKALIQKAQKMTPGQKFFAADASLPLPLEKKTFDRVSFILSLQNMEKGKEAIFIAASHLARGGKMLFVLNHPCFRIPRQSSWGIDEKKKLQYRRIESYKTAQKIPIQTAPSQKEKSATTYSYHHPLSEIVLWLQNGKLVIENLEEWYSDKKSEGPKSKMEDRARGEIPLFLCLIARKEE